MKQTTTPSFFTQTNLLLLVVLLTCAFSLKANNPIKTTLVIKQARIPAAPPNTTIMAAYLSIKNPTNNAITLTGFSSPHYKSIEMHLSVVNKKGMASMVKLKTLTIKANTTLEFKPGSYHLMLFKPTKQFNLKRQLEMNAIIQSSSPHLSKIKFKAIIIDRSQADQKSHQHSHH